MYCYVCTHILLISMAYHDRDEFGDVEGSTPDEQVKSMMKEIYHRGPIACGIAVTEDLYHDYKGGVYYDTTNNTQIVHGN